MTRALKELNLVTSDAGIWGYVFKSFRRGRPWRSLSHLNTPKDFWLHEKAFNDQMEKKKRHTPWAMNVRQHPSPATWVLCPWLWMVGLVCMNGGCLTRSATVFLLTENNVEPCSGQGRLNSPKGSLYCLPVYDLYAVIISLLCSIGANRCTSWCCVQPWQQSASRTLSLSGASLPGLRAVPVLSAFHGFLQR